MKLFSVYILTIFLASFAGGLDAQVKTGYTIGLNISDISLKNAGTAIKSEMATGIHFGEVFDIPLSGNFTFEPAFILSSKGTLYRIDTIQYTIYPVYVEIPALAMFSFGPEAVRFTVFAGPYISSGVGGRIDEGIGSRPIRFGAGVNRDIRHFDAGFCLGAGFNLKGFLISAQYDLGLMNISPESRTGSEMKNKVMEISLSSSFAGK